MGIIIERQSFESQDLVFQKKLTRKETQVDFSSDPELSSLKFGLGTLFVHEEFLGFYSEETQTGFKIDYRRVVLHAISLDSESQRKVIYIQLDTQFDCPALDDNPSAKEEKQDDYDNFSEIRFLLTDPYSAEPLYKAISHCQFLHPDFLGSDSESETEDVFEDAEEEEEDSTTTEASSQDQAIIEANIAHLERALERGKMESACSINGTESSAAPNQPNGKSTDSEIR